MPALLHPLLNLFQPRLLSFCGHSSCLLKSWIPVPDQEPSAKSASSPSVFYFHTGMYTQYPGLRSKLPWKEAKRSRGTASGAITSVTSDTPRAWTQSARGLRLHSWQPKLPLPCGFCWAALLTPSRGPTSMSESPTGLR